MKKIEEMYRDAKTLEELEKVAEFILESKFAPSGLRSAKEIVGVCDVGLSIGLSLQESLEGVVSIDGHVCIKGDTALALVRRSGLLQQFEAYPKNEDLSCTILMKRKGEPLFTSEYNYQMAVENNLTDTKWWRMFPERMIYYRALSYALRTCFSDILQSMHTVEEMQDLFQQKKFDQQSVSTNTIGKIKGL